MSIISELVISSEKDGAIEELKKIKDKMMDDGAYFREVEGHTDFVKGISHCIDIVEKELLRLEGEIKL